MACFEVIVHHFEDQGWSCAVFCVGMRLGRSAFGLEERQDDCVWKKKKEEREPKGEN